MTTQGGVPNTLRVVVLAKGSRTPLKSVVVLVTLIVPYKNNYTIGPTLTDDSGQVCFTRDEMVQEVELCQKHSPMDYSAGLGEMTGVEVRVPDAEGIDRLLKASDWWGIGVPEWRLSGETIGRLRCAPNRLYMAATARVSRAEFTKDLRVTVLLEPLAQV